MSFSEISIRGGGIALTSMNGVGNIVAIHPDFGKVVTASIGVGDTGWLALPRVGEIQAYNNGKPIFEVRAVGGGGISIKEDLDSIGTLATITTGQVATIYLVASDESSNRYHVRIRSENPVNAPAFTSLTSDFGSEVVLPAVESASICHYYRIVNCSTSDVKFTYTGYMGQPSLDDFVGRVVLAFDDPEDPDFTQRSCWIVYRLEYFGQSFSWEVFPISSVVDYESCSDCQGTIIDENCIDGFHSCTPLDCTGNVESPSSCNFMFVLDSIEGASITEILAEVPDLTFSGPTSLAALLTTILERDIQFCGCFTEFKLGPCQFPSSGTNPYGAEVQCRRRTIFCFGTGVKAYTEFTFTGFCFAQADPVNDCSIFQGRQECCCGAG